MKPQTPVHLGSLIKSKVKERRMSITEFAKKLHCQRVSVYHLFKQKKSIYFDKLLIISDILNHDFIGEYYSKSNPTLSCENQNTCSHFRRQSSKTSIACTQCDCEIFL
ncbi:MAG: helix-turn-helix transcriptional regulator [Bacteroidales bacterium]|jgi:predicted transcriptional regulator|nr:helix-turn-helix transcriptional regulator [Bacteroidales bacterium]